MTIGVDCELMFLIDNWPGAPTPGACPTDFTALSATEDYPLGSKRQVYDDTSQGFSTLMFLYYTTGAGTVRVATVGEPCGIDSTAMATAGQFTHITNDGSDAELLGPIAICLGTMVNARYGWFWVGGVCPVTLVSELGDHLSPSDASVTAGIYMVLADSASVTKFHLGAATDFCAFSAFSATADTTA